MTDLEQKPRLRFKGFTEAWEQRIIKDLITKGGSGGTPSTSNASFYDGIIPFLSITDISNSNGFIFDTEKHITESALNSSAAWIVPKESVSLAMYASVGKVAILKENIATSQAFYNMIFKTIELRDYCFQYLKKMEISNEWIPYISTGTQANLNAEKVQNLKLYVPSEKCEQKKIGQLFYKLDSLITLHQRKYEKLKSMKAALLEKMFPSENETTPKIRFKGFTEAWEQRKYEDIGSNFNGGTLSYASLDENGKLKCVLYGDLYTLYDSIILKIERKTNFKGNTIFKNDILFPQSTTVDAYSLISPACLNEETAETSGVFVIRPNKNIDGNFIAYYSKGNEKQRNKLAKNAQGLTIVHLYYQSIKNEILYIPNLKEQKMISAFFMRLDSLITLHQRKLIF